MDKKKERWKYEDMLYMPHKVSSTRPQMEVSVRAAQFSPFAALTGYEAAIEETKRLTEAFVELDESRKEELNKKLQVLMEQAEEKQTAVITYFKPDKRKEGGEYIEVIGKLKKVNFYEQCLVMEDETIIPLAHIYEIEIPKGR